MKIKKKEIIKALSVLGYRPGEIAKIIYPGRDPKKALDNIGAHLYITREMNMNHREAMEKVLYYVYKQVYEPLDDEFSSIWLLAKPVFKETFDKFYELYCERKKWNTEKPLIAAYIYMVYYTALLLWPEWKMGRKKLLNILYCLTGKHKDLFHINIDVLYSIFAEHIAEKALPSKWIRTLAT